MRWRIRGRRKELARLKKEKKGCCFPAALDKLISYQLHFTDLAIKRKRFSSNVFPSESLSVG